MTDAMVNAFDPLSTISASSLTPRLALSADAHAVVASGANVRICLEELLARELFADALVVVARTLPKRYVVAWTCECLKGVLTGQPIVADVDRAGLALAQQWLAEPSEENRRAAQEFAELGELASPGAWVAASAGWNGGSLAPRGYDTISPPDDLPAEAGVAALRLAASQSSDYAGAINAFITRAVQIFGPPLHATATGTRQ